jgi:hypothetical protein
MTVPGHFTKPFIATLILIVTLATAQSASAYRQPTTTERAQIIVAIKQEMLKEGDSWCYGPATRCAQIGHIRVSVANPAFATAAIYKASIGGALILLHKLYGTWRVTALGSAFVGCGKAPKAVRVDLEISCPGGK